MPRSDWERADRARSQADQPAAGRDLAHRLSRLPSGHPSAWPAADRAEAGHGERQLEEWWRPRADTERDDTEPGDTEPDGADAVPEDYDDEPDAVPPGDDADLEDVVGEPRDAARPPAAGPGGRRSGPPTGAGELDGPPARSPYRPWFSADGAADPWFAAVETEHSEIKHSEIKYSETE
jgi:hypothetical protein